MKMKKYGKNILCVLLCMLMTLGMLSGIILPVSAEDEAERTNVALNKTVSAPSYMLNQNRLPRITDGTIGQASGTALIDYAYEHRTARQDLDADEKPYVTIDLGTDCMIDEVVYFGGFNSGYATISHNVVIQISMDPDFADATTKTVYNTDFNNFFGFGKGTDVDAVNNEPFNTVDGISARFMESRARYVRYYQKGNSFKTHNPRNSVTPNAMILEEIRVFGYALKRENLALNKTVSAPSYMLNQNRLPRITDGTIGQASGTALIDYAYEHRTARQDLDAVEKPYVTIDLGTDCMIDEVVYFGGFNSGYATISHNVVIQISMDPDFADATTKTVYNTDFNNFFGFGKGTDVDAVNNEPFNTVDGISARFMESRARYVRYYQKGNSFKTHNPRNSITPNAMILEEIQVFGYQNASKNLALGKPVTAAPTMTSCIQGTLGMVTDGTILTNGSAYNYRGMSPYVDVEQSADDKPYITVDLEKNYAINQIVFFGPLNNYPNYYTQSLNVVIQISQDPDFKDSSTKIVYNTDINNFFGLGKGTDTTELYGESINTPDGVSVFFDKTTARYIRFYQKGQRWNNHVDGSTGEKFSRTPDCLAVNEIEVYSKEISNVTFDYNDPAVQSTETQYVENHTFVQKPATPYHSELGKLFDKWTVNKADGAEWDFYEVVKGDMTLVANWKDAAIRTVTFDTVGGSAVEPVSVTDTLTLARPENPTKEGYTFAGWKLGGKRFNFNTPITADITLTAQWLAPATSDAVTFSAGMLEITLDSYGRVEGLYSDLNGKEYYSDGPDGAYRGLISLVADYYVESPTKVTRREDVLTFEFATVGVTATVTAKDNGNYTALTLSELSNPYDASLQAVLWGPIKTTFTTGGQTIGTVYDDEFAIGMHMLNTKTIGGWPIEFKDDFYMPNLPNVNGLKDTRVWRDIYLNTATFCDWGSALNAYSWDYTKDTLRTIHPNREGDQIHPAMTGKYADTLASMIGSSVGIYGTRPDNVLNVIENIQLTEGLPYMTINGGEWQKTSIYANQDYLVFKDDMYANIDNDIQMAKDAGINYIYDQSGGGGTGPWQKDGDYTFNNNFGGSDETAKEMVEKAEEAGLSIGTHMLTNLINYSSEYVSENNEALSVYATTEVTRTVKSLDNVIYVKDGSRFSPNGVSLDPYQTKADMVRIGNEIITFSACKQISEDEWVLTGCTRGAFSTTAAAHEVGDKADRIWAYFGRLVGGWESLEPMKERMAILAQDVGIKFFTYDSFESTKQSVYGSLMPTVFRLEDYNAFKEAGMVDGFITEASDIQSNVWDLQTRMSLGESNTNVKNILGHMQYFEQNYMHQMIGQTYDGGSHGGYDEASLMMTLSMKASWDAGTGWYVTKDTFETYPHMPGMIKLWNNAIDKGAFVVGENYTEELQSAMRNAWTNGRIWSLTEVVPDREWVLQEVSKSDVTQKIGDPVTLYASCDIEITQPENGNLTTDRSREYHRAHEGDVVTVYEQAFTDCSLIADTLSVVGEDGTEYEVTPVAGETGAYTFTMPAQSVSVTAEFARAEAKIDDTAYATLEEALAEAKADDTITLNSDAVVDYITIDPAVTLDLNGKVLTAEYVVGFKGSAICGEGKLIVDKNKVSLDKANGGFLPVYEEGGYIFTTVKLENRTAFISEQTYALSPVFETFTHEALVKGYGESNVKIVIRLTWEEEGNYRAKQDFTYVDEMVATVIGSYDAAEDNYARAFSAAFAGSEAGQAENVKVSAVVISDTGVEIASSAVTFEG